MTIHDSTKNWRQRLGGEDVPYVDSRIYTEASIFEEELQKIWRRTWLLVAHESELPEPLDFRTTSIAREPVIVVRGEDGKVRAFLNVCPHRGALLLRAPAGNLATANPSGREMDSAVTAFASGGAAPDSRDRSRSSAH